MKLPQALALMCLAWLLSLPSALAAKSIETQREQFLLAEKALSKGQYGQFHKLKKQLRDYPLLPYLEFAQITGRLNGKSGNQVQEFLTRYPNTPLAPRLRARWLDHLADKGRWSEYLKFFEPTKNTRRRCNYLHALIATGNHDSAFKQVPQLWLHGRSQPKSCDPVFKAWRDSGKLTAELTWQRIALAMDKGETRLAGYLKRYLPKNEHIWVEHWIGLRGDPSRIMQQQLFTIAHPRRNEILLYGLNRLARQDADKAEAAWKILRQRYPFNTEQLAKGERILAYAYIRHRHPDVLARLDRVNPGDDLKLHRKRILSALQHTDWKRALSRINDLPEPERNSETWRYWQGRALLGLGKDDEGRAVLKSVSRDRTYYAFLAADLIGDDYYLRHKALNVRPGIMQQVIRMPGVLRTRELRALQRHLDARREWWTLTRDMNPGELMAAARLASNWDWDDQAIFTLARSGYWDDLELRFPLEHLDLLERYAQDNGLTLPWVLALVRQESAFGPRAHSHAGARGLMQLMPRTARSVAKKLGKPRPRMQDLFEPKTNIPLGTAYLGQVYRRLDHHPVLATAAYNAGPHRVSRWLPAHTQDADIWVENIPFKETRQYVQRVMSYAVIYEKRLGRAPGSILARMRPIQGKLERAAVSRQSGKKAGQSES